MNTDRFRKVIFTVLFCILSSVGTGIYAQGIEVPQIPGDAAVTVVGGGGAPLEDGKIANGGGTDDFGTVYSADGDLTITLKDVYITDNLAVITLSLGTSRSATGHMSSGEVYINGEQRAGGGSAGLAEGEPFERTMTLAFYGRMFDAKAGTGWDRLRISFDGLVLAAYEGTDSGYIGVPDGYNWSFVFHNPEISRYNGDGSGAPADEQGTHLYGDRVEIELAGFSAEGDLNFDLIQKTDLLNDYGSQNALWVNDRQQGGGGNSVAFDADGVPEVTEDTKFVRTDHFLYPSAGETVRPDSLAVWARSVTFELTEAGTPRTWSMALSEDLFPMKLVQFCNVK